MKALLLLPLLLLLSACSHADAPANPPSGAHAETSATRPSAAHDSPVADVSAVQRALAAQGIEITGTLVAPKGYQGFIASYRGQELPVYVLPDGRHIVVGTLFDLGGNNLTARALAEAAGRSFGETQWQELASATWVGEGNPRAQRVVYTFVDTRCPYCHQFWEKSQGWLKQGKVQVRNILVAVIAPQSLPEAAAILDAKDSARAWNRSEKNFGKNSEPGGNSSAAALAKVRANTELMTSLGFMGTPSIIWKDARGQIHTLQGLPRDPGTLAAVFGG